VLSEVDSEISLHPDEHERLVISDGWIAVDNVLVSGKSDEWDFDRGILHRIINSKRRSNLQKLFYELKLFPSQS
jgi:hypothetical protein